MEERQGPQDGAQRVRTQEDCWVCPRSHWWGLKRKSQAVVNDSNTHREQMMKSEWAGRTGKQRCTSQRYREAKHTSGWKGGRADAVEHKHPGVTRRVSARHDTPSVVWSLLTANTDKCPFLGSAGLFVRMMPSRALFLEHTQKEPSLWESINLLKPKNNGGNERTSPREGSVMSP